MLKKFSLIALLLAGCHRTSDNDGLQAHEQQALNILEHYLEKEEAH